MCVLSFGGTSSAVDVMYGMHAFPMKNICGHKFHNGFARLLLAELDSDRWKDEIMPVLEGPLCDKKVTVVGHSIGGAMAEIFAACANSRKKKSASDERAVKIDVTVDRLYTYGAPPISNETVTDGMAEDGCFSGDRIYNANRVEHDPIARLAFRIGFVHPQVDAVRYQFHRRKQVYERHEIKCGKGEDVENLPDKGSPLSAPNMLLHQATRYMYQAARIRR